MAHDAVVSQQTTNIRRREASHLPRVEASEGLPIAFALPKDGQPAQTGLRAFQDEELEEPTIVVLGDTPLLIVVLDVKRVASPTAAALHPRDSISPRSSPAVEGHFTLSTRLSAYPSSSTLAVMARTYRLNAWRRVANVLVRTLLRVGIGPPHTYLLTVRGRTSGRVYS